jgi:hypothetical protein
MTHLTYTENKFNVMHTFFNARNYGLLLEFYFLIVAHF